MIKKQKTLTLLCAFIVGIAFFSFKGEVLPAFADLVAIETMPEYQRMFHYFFPFVANGIKTDEFPVDPVGPIGGTFTTVMTDPNNPNIVYGGHFQSGVFKSFNQGQNWFEKNRGLSNIKIQSMAIHPRHSNILYAGTYGGGVFLSRNGGDSWEPWSGGILHNHIVYDIEIDPCNPSDVYVASRIPGSLVGYISRSKDAGKTWQIVFRGDWFDTPDYFYNIAVHPNYNNIIYFASHEHGFYRSTNYGDVFYPINNGVTDLTARGFAMGVTESNLIFGSVWKGSGVFRSWDAGDNWQLASYGLPSTIRITKIKTDQNFVETGRYFVVSQSHGLFSSENNGEFWIYRGLDGNHINDIAIAYGDRQTWFLATQVNGMVRTQDGGATWSTVMDDLRLYSVTGFQQIPIDPGAVYVAIYGQGVFRYVFDSGEWVSLNDQLQNLNVNALYATENDLWLSNDDGFFQLKPDGWKRIALVPSSTYDNAMLPAWQNYRLGIPLESLFDEVDERGCYQFQSCIVENLSVTTFKAFSEGYLIGTPDGLWLKSGMLIERAGLEGKLIYAIEDYNNSIWVSACDADLQCSIWSLTGDVWKDVSEGVLNIRVNHLLSTNEKLLAATDKGIYQWLENNNTWALIEAKDDIVWEMRQNPLASNQILASSNGKLFFSEDGGKTWIDIALTKQRTYLHAFFVPDDNVKILLGSLESGAFLFDYQQK